MVFRKRKIEEEVEALIEPVLEAEGFEVVAVEYGQTYNGKVLRIYVDKSGGITLGDCELVNRTVNRLLEADGVSDLKYQAFGVEVSSPGIDRILKKKGDFEKFAGNSVRIQLYEPVSEEKNQRNFVGELKGMKGNDVIIVVDGSEVKIPWEKIKVAHIKRTFK